MADLRWRDDERRRWEDEGYRYGGDGFGRSGSWSRPDRYGRD